MRKIVLADADKLIKEGHNNAYKDVKVKMQEGDNKL